MEGEANLPPSSSRTSLRDIANSESTTSLKGMASSATSITKEISITGERNFLGPIYSMRFNLKIPGNRQLLGFKQVKFFDS